MMPRHLVLGQEHRLQAGRCDEKPPSSNDRAGDAASHRRGRAEGENGLIPGDVGHVCSGTHQIGRAKSSKIKEGSQWHGFLSWGDSRCSAFTSTTRRSGLNAISRYWTAASREIRRCPGLWILAGDFNMEPETFGQYATPARLPGVLVKSAVPTFRHRASVRCFDYFVVHHAVACHVREVRVLEESGVSPHHRGVQMKLKRCFQGLVTRVQVTPSALTAPIVGCAREPRCWDFAQSTGMDESWKQLMQCTEREILGGCDILGDEARAHMGRGLTPRRVIKKVAPAKSYNRPRMARDTRWWRVLSNRLRELWLMEALPTRRPHLPQQPEQIERLRVHLRRMANEARGEPELQTLKDVHWRALIVLDKLHKRDRRVREKSIAEYAREASKGAAGLLHRLTKPRPVWCPRDAAQGEATNPRDAAELAANSWSRIWRVHIEELQNADRPWESPNGDDMSALPQLEVEGPSGFDAVKVGSFRKQLYTDLLNDVERTLT